MDIIQGFYRFQFHQNFIFHQEIGHVLSNHDAVVNNVHTSLLKHNQSFLAQFMGKGVFIDFFQKSAAKGIGNCVGITNDLFRYY